MSMINFSFSRNILRSIVIALPLVTGIYFMMNVAYIAVLTVPEMLSAPAVAVVSLPQLIFLKIIFYFPKTFNF